MIISNFNHLRAREWALAALILLLSFLLVFVSRTWRLQGDSAITPTADTVLLIHEGIDLEELIGLMDENGFEYRPDELRWASVILGWRRFSQGRYVFDGPVGYQDFFSKLALGLQDPMMLRIPPGASKDALKERIAAQMQFETPELADAMRDTSLLNQYGIVAHQLYGRILPDSYEVYWTSTPHRLLERLLSEFDSRVAEPYADRMRELGRSVDEITTLASIIEWEARFDDEKPAISGLYWNRLNRRWRLQADPTVNYAKGERSRLVFADYRIDHPYNTYRIHGLPPGPITNPSFASIRAALYPDEHNYMFMVARPDGRHGFSQTYAEHRRKSREWTDWLREQRRIREAAEREEALRQEVGPAPGQTSGPAPGDGSGSED